MPVIVGATTTRAIKLFVAVAETIWAAADPGDAFAHQGAGQQDVRRLYYTLCARGAGLTSVVSAHGSFGLGVALGRLAPDGVVVPWLEARSIRRMNIGTTTALPMSLPVLVS